MGRWSVETSDSTHFLRAKLLSGGIWLPPVKPSVLQSLTGGTEFCKIADLGVILPPTLPKVVPTWHQIVTQSALNGARSDKMAPKVC